MALKFPEAKGQAVSNKQDYYKFVDGEQSVRLLDLLARYVYWIDGENGKKLPIECLAFNRETETFDNAEKDWVKEFYPDIKCGKAYVSQCIAEGKVMMFGHKAKLLSAIIDEVKDLGDPTDPENGWNIVFEKKKTGPLPINVEYTLKGRKLKNTPLTDEEKELIKEIKPIEEVMPRPTPASQKEFLEKLRNKSTENIDEDVGEEFDVS